MADRLFLTGFMGCGKSATGRQLAGDLGHAFVDLDEWIEEEVGAEVREVFVAHGEPVFRDLETQALERTGTLEEVVVATGGGTMTLERNREWMRRHGLTIFLDLPFRDIAARLDMGERARRPLFRDEEKARALYEERLPCYRRSDWAISIDSSETARHVADRIVSKLGERECNS